MLATVARGVVAGLSWSLIGDARAWDVGEKLELKPRKRATKSSLANELCIELYWPWPWPIQGPCNVPNV